MISNARNRNRRAQTSFEAISLFALATLILSIFMIYFGGQVSTKANQREYQSLRDIAGTLQQEVAIARQAGPGYARTLTLPDQNGGKNLTITVLSSQNLSQSSEVVVKFDPPITAGLEATQLLGPRVYGTFAGGVNWIRTYPGGIIVQPNLTYDNAKHMNNPPQPSIAFAHIPVSTAHRSTALACQWGLANLWAEDTQLSSYVIVYWNDTTRTGVQRACAYQVEAVAPRDLTGTATVAWTDLGPEFVKGTNVTCSAQFINATHLPTAIGYVPDCAQVHATLQGTLGRDPPTAVSESVPIENSLPNLTIEPASTSSYQMGATVPGQNETTWPDLRFNYTVSDADPGDTRFNITLVKDGTNAPFIQCLDQYGNPLPTCTVSVLTGTHEFRINATIPWPAQGSCSSVDRLTFKLRAIENDSSEGLYTLKPVDLTNQLGCPTSGGTAVP